MNAYIYQKSDTFNGRIDELTLERELSFVANINSVRRFSGQIYVETDAFDANEKTSIDAVIAAHKGNKSKVLDISFYDLRLAAVRAAIEDLRTNPAVTVNHNYNRVVRLFQAINTELQTWLLTGRIGVLLSKLDDLALQTNNTAALLNEVYSGSGAETVTVKDHIVSLIDVNKLNF